MRGSKTDGVPPLYWYLSFLLVPGVTFLAFAKPTRAGATRVATSGVDGADVAKLFAGCRGVFPVASESEGGDATMGATKGSATDATTTTVSLVVLARGSCLSRGGSRDFSARILAVSDTVADTRGATDGTRFTTRGSWGRPGAGAWGITAE